MSFEILFKETEARMRKAIDALHNELAKLRTGRANPGLVTNVMVDYYGSPMPLSQVANIAVLDARTLTVSPWEKKLIPVIEKAILTSGLGLNPATSGDVIRIPLPALTEDRRRELVKMVKAEVENTKVSVRTVRRDINSIIKEAVKNKTMTEDEEHKGQERVQKLTDNLVAEIDKICQKKEAELMEV